MHDVSCGKVNLFDVFHQHVNCIWCLHVWDTHRLPCRFRCSAVHSPCLFTTVSRACTGHRLLGMSVTLL